MSARPLLIASGIGFAMQLAMVVAGHYLAWIRINGFAIGGMLISLIAGALYSHAARVKWSAALAGGAVAGGACALFAIAISVALRDVPAAILVIGTAASVVTGLAGGAIGRLILLKRGAAL